MRCLESGGAGGTCSQVREQEQEKKGRTETGKVETEEDEAARLPAREMGGSMNGDEVALFGAGKRARDDRRRRRRRRGRQPHLARSISTINFTPATVFNRLHLMLHHPSTTKYFLFA